MILLYLIVGGILTFLFVSMLIGWLLSAPAYKGPESDHFNGKKFKNPEGVFSNSFAKVVRYMASKERGIWNQAGLMKRYVPKSAIWGNDVCITFVNHSTFLIQCNGVNILTDPIWSKRCSPFQWIGPKRFHPPGIALSDLPKIDLILLSHNHYDHLDISTLKTLYKKHKPLVITPLGVDLYLAKKGIPCKHVLDWYQKAMVNESITVMATPAQHFSSRGLFDRDKTLWCGYGIKSGDEWLWFTGDSGYGKFFNKIGEQLQPLRAAIIPIGAYKPQWFMRPIHLSPADALRVHNDVKSPFSIACHFGTFPLAKDGMDEPVNELLKNINDNEDSKVEFSIPTPGKPIYVPSLTK